MTVTVHTVDSTQNTSDQITLANIGTDLAALAAAENATAATVAAGSGALATHTGTVTLNGATGVAVANANVTANSQILLTLKTAHTPGGTTPTAGPYLSSITPGTGFTVIGTAGDVSVFNYMIMG